MCAIFCNDTVVRLRLAFVRHLWWALVAKAFLQRLTSAHPQEKEKARSDERA